MRATRFVITLLAFLPSLFIIKADETELTEMRLVSDSLIYMIQSNVDCDGQKNLQNSHLETEDSTPGCYLRQSLLNTTCADLNLLNISDSLPLAIV